MRGMVIEAVKALTAEEITELCLRHTLYDWSAQAGLKPLPVTGAKGVHFHTADGRRFLDFNSQLMSVNAGHGAVEGPGAAGRPRSPDADAPRPPPARTHGAGPVRNLPSTGRPDRTRTSSGAGAGGTRSSRSSTRGSSRVAATSM